MSKNDHGPIRVGIGGWTYEPWRGTFFPEGLTQKRELEYAASKLTSIEINGTYYGSQKPESFAKWHDETPDGFVFSLKGPRFATNKRVLSEAGPSIEKFVTSGIVELKDKLGPINWQFAGTKKFDPGDFEGFLKLLPKSVEGRPLRHALEVRNESFRSPEFVAMAREYGAAIIVSADGEFPQIADITAPFVYLRLLGSTETEVNGYSDADIKAWVERAQKLAEGEVPGELQTASEVKAAPGPREVFLYFISGFKERNPAAAMAMIERLK
jgi:uncharacterized protein YecE (DUF72 family)